MSAEGRAGPRSALGAVAAAVNPSRPSLPLGKLLLALACATSALSSVPPAFSVTETIEKIEVRGLRRMTVDAFIFASGLKSGQTYDAAEIRRSFRRLWDRGLFSDLKIDVEDGESGKLVVFTARERPIVVSVDYDEVKAITRSNIEDRFKERSLELAVGKPLDRRVIHRAEDVIHDLLAEKGYLDATVNAEITTVSESSSAVRFRIKQGSRTRIRKIEFVGNEVYSDRKLKHEMKLTREHSILSSVGGKDIYFPLKYDQDIEKVRDLYQNAGYLDVDLKPPQVEIRQGGKTSRGSREKSEQAGGMEKIGGTAPGPETGESSQTPPAEPAQGTEQPKPGDRTGEMGVGEPKKAPGEDKHVRKWVYLTIRINEGPQYRVGEIKTNGNTVLTDSEVLKHIPLSQGEIFNRSLLDTGVDLLRASYGEKGYIYASVGRNVEKKTGNVADVTIEIREDKPYRVDRIEFEGNTTTRDEVLRREMRLSEGDLLNKRKLNLSVYKLNQLGFNVPVEEPIIEPVAGTDRARVRVRTEEKGRNEIQVGGGFSGQDGFFFQGSYQTHNFLGRGENLSLFLQAGGRSSRYTLAFTEPYFLAKPVTLGFRLFRQDIEFAQRATRTGNGGSVTLGRQIGDFAAASVLYSYESIRALDRNVIVSSGSTLSETTTTIGSLTPSFIYNHVNNPFRPNRGRAFSIALETAGRYLGGDNNFIKPLLVGTAYRPLTRRSYLGVHGEFGLVSPYGVGTLSTGQILGVPRFERFFLGGEFLGPRGFETRSISPVRYISRDGRSIIRDKSDILAFKGKDVFGNRIEKCLRPEFDNTLDRVVDPDTGKPSQKYAVCSNGLRQVLIGANRYVLTQMEYDLSAGGPFVFGVFLDVGNALAEDEGFSFAESRVSAGIETRIYLPVFQAPLRFIYGFPLRQEPFDTTSRFTFSIGQSF